MVASLGGRSGPQRAGAASDHPPKLSVVRGIRGVLSAVVVSAALVACAPDAPLVAAPPGDATAGGAVIEWIVDGDTIETDAGTVRIIGVDAPERDMCGYAEASALVASLLAPGETIVLELPAGQNAEDRYGRLLRYVDTADGVDIGSSLLSAGLAVARYDSTDGYPAHPRETDYHALQIATLSATRDVVAVGCQPAAG